MPAKFILSKKVLKEQIKKLEDEGLKISYSYKTNRIVGKVLQEIEEGKNVSFSIHAKEEIEEIREKSKIWFFNQAESEQELREIFNKGIRNFVVDNEVDFERLLKIAEKMNIVINLSLRMKFQEHRVGTGKYFVYGMPSMKVNDLISRIKNNNLVGKLGIHLHRKSQNTSEWEILEELKDSLTEENLKRINFVNIGGGLPSFYRSSNVDNFTYIFQKISELKNWLNERNIKLVIEPGRFLAAPCVRLETEIIQKYNNCLVLNTTIYNCALDNVITETKMLVEGELSDSEEGEFFLLKGNSPTRDDIFRYKVKLKKDIKVGDKIVFLNAGAYNYTTDFFGYKKLDTEIKEDF
jgi:ornithine decarboxylase